ncbi:hypothetical protein GTP38_24180 [Duganella sp. FT94W]|uniref:DUF2059 domain-containing protein n=1 Tax=Duganella lactea TaxID=2692173 RepID=A0ABW9VD75_9BURK|nr:hypothetical protein [Duganella lactea]MYM37430.1 hypothetical protein [Duganella lactea]
MQTIVKLIVLFSLLLGQAPFAMAGPTESAATEFVNSRQLGRNMKTLAFVAAMRTHTFAMMLSKLSVTQAQSLLSQELDAYAHQFQGQWNANLAQVYARHFTVEELRSLASEGRNSRFIGKLASQQGSIGAEMQSLSAPILISYVSAALNSAIDKLPR